MAKHLETITLGGGCFWCIEAVYEQVEGVVSVESGYCNGHVKKPSYEQVCTGETGHAEVVRVTFDPARIGLHQLLEIFFVVHDPTTPDRQGNDIGTQYRSGIYYESAEHERIASDVLSELAQSGAYQAPIVTELAPLANYSRAEDYHQHYFAQHPEQGYCSFVVAPKVEKFRKTFSRHVRQGG